MRLRQSDRFRSRFYASGRWRALRAEKMRSTGYRCEGCGRMGQALEVHHTQAVNERSGDAELFPPLEGLRALCYPCHRARHRKPSPVRGRDEWLTYLLR